MKEYVMMTLKKALKSYLAILPIAIVGGITVGMYTAEHSDPVIIETAIQQLGSYSAFLVLTTLQTFLYSVFGWVVGYFIVDRIGLIKSFRFEKVNLIRVCPVIILLGILFASDYFIMGRLIPEVAADYEKGISPAYLISFRNGFLFWQM